MALGAPSSVVPTPPDSLVEVSTMPNSSANNGHEDPSMMAQVDINVTTPASPQQQSPQQSLSIQNRLALKPYSFDGNGNIPPPPADVLQLWIEVGNGIDKSQTGEFTVSQIRPSLYSSIALTKLEKQGNKKKEYKNIIDGLILIV
jgi:hypothetical protein